MKKIQHPDTLSMNYDFPRLVVVEPINLCNLHCSICPQKSLTREPAILPWAFWRKIVDEIADTDKSVQLWPALMGEPLLLGADLWRRIAYAKSRKIENVILNTNGVLLKESDLWAMRDCGLDELIVGIDAATEDTYRKIRCGAELVRVDANVRNLIGQQRCSLSDRNKPKIVVQFIESERNKGETDIFIKHWLDKGAIVKVRRMLEWGNTNGLPQASELRSDSVARYPCPWLMRSISIHSNGNIVRCDAFWNAATSEFNIKENTIKESWDALRKDRDIHKNKLWDNDQKCKDCHDWKCGLSQKYYPEGCCEGSKND